MSPPCKDSEQNEREVKPGDSSSAGDDTTEADGAAAEKATTELDKGENNEYIAGLELVLVMVSLTLTCFLMLLDTSIISTVSGLAYFDRSADFTQRTD